jgi:hypothetical protein
VKRKTLNAIGQLPTSAQYQKYLRNSWKYKTATIVKLLVIANMGSNGTESLAHCQLIFEI